MMEAVDGGIERGRKGGKKDRWGVWKCEWGMG